MEAPTAPPPPPPEDPSYNHQYAQLNGIHMHYIDVGPRDGVALVLVHGFPDLWYGWRYQIQNLRQTYRVIVADNRGFGDSDAPADVDSYRRKNITQDYVALLDHLKIDQAVFVGHDWGGDCVFKMFLFHPTRVRAVASICTPYIPIQPTKIPLSDLVHVWPEFEYQLTFVDPNYAAICDTHPANFLNAVFANPPTEPPASFAAYMQAISTVHFQFPHPPIVSAEDFAYYLAQYRKTGFQGGLNWYRVNDLDWDDLCDRPMAQIPHHALFIGADADFILRPYMSEGMEKLIPQLTRVHIEDGDHWVHWKKPTQVNDILNDWLASIVNRFRSSSSYSCREAFVQASQGLYLKLISTARSLAQSPYFFVVVVVKPLAAKMRPIVATMGPVTLAFPFLPSEFISRSCSPMPPRLVVTLQPASEFYKDEGGRSNYLTVQVAVTDDRGDVPWNVSNDAMPLRMTLLYESGKLVEEQEILRVVGDASTSVSMRGGTATVHFRLEKVSRRKDGQRFKVQIDVDSLHLSASTIPICVLSKRKDVAVAPDKAKLSATASRGTKAPRRATTHETTQPTPAPADATLARHVSLMQAQLVRLTHLVEAQHQLLAQLVHGKDLDALLRSENTSFLSAMPSRQPPPTAPAWSRHGLDESCFSPSTLPQDNQLFRLL
ncbi:Aste57867_1135 [Aphanomyces stellatus]|uniref:Aste57867_1135 protein n=1 Tax=Aphanomyces stellatus TaxID=120398 RepID=A0A485K4M4_9STRA|nr:hypothetical protein As57867_001134 [Aphanomyces stellatus]VFT78355.1 Aste57867_1135 [Aphanomyces stellatus]